MRVPEIHLREPGGRVLILRADHLAFFSLEQAYDKPLPQILREPETASLSEIYSFTWHFLTTWRLDNDPGLSFEDFLRCLPTGAEWLQFSTVDMPEMIRKALNPIAPVVEGGNSKKNPTSGLPGPASSLKQRLSAKIQTLFGGAAQPETTPSYGSEPDT